MNRRKFFPALIGLPVVAKAMPKMIQRKGKEFPCDTCGKEMYNEKTDCKCAGISMSYYDSNKGNKKFTKRFLGDYKPNRSYNVCWECWLKSLGVKP